MKKNIERKGNLILSNYTKAWIEIPEWPSVTSSDQDGAQGKNQEAKEDMEADRVHNNLGTRLERGQADASREKIKPELSEARS